MVLRCFAVCQGSSIPRHASENDKRILKRLAMGFLLDGEVLYKRRKDQILLRCVDSSEANRIVEEIHERVCETHANGHRMAGQVMRACYYWLTLERDCIQYARKCHKCQIYSDKIHVPPTELHVMAPPWPFSMWGMDVIRPITPKAFNGHRFIFVVIDYFTKWVEAASYASVTRSVICRFIKKEIICRYRISKRIIRITPPIWITRWWSKSVSNSRSNITILCNTVQRWMG